MKTSSAPYRDELFISTKAGHDMWPGPYGEWGSRKTDDPRYIEISCRQGRVSIRISEEGIPDEAYNTGVGFMTFSPLAQGLLTDRYLNGIPEDYRVAGGGFLGKEMRKRVSPSE